MGGCSCGGYVYDGICLECGRDVGEGLELGPDAYMERVQAESDAAAKEARDELKAERELAALERDSFDGFDPY